MASKTSCYRHAIRDSRIATSANKLVGKLQAVIFLWSTKSARAVAWLLIQRLPFCSRLSKRLQEGTKTPRSSEVYIEAIAHIFPYSSCSRIYSGGWAIGEGYETANCSSRADVASCVPSICRCAFSTRARHRILTWRSLIRECSLVWRTVELCTLCYQSKEKTL